MIVDSKLNSLGYDDVLLLPKPTTIDTRDEVNLYDSLPKQAMPIFSSPMKNISEPDVVIQISKLGGIGILHRFFNSEETRREALEKVVEGIGDNNLPFGVSIGVKDMQNELDFALYAIEAGASYICVDTANGYMSKTIEVVKRLKVYKNLFADSFSIISGNVVDSTGVVQLAKAGSDWVRVGIGSGNLCSTSNNTGIGCPMLTAIQEATVAKSVLDVKIIADGGIKSSGEAVKAFAFGADAVMVGSLFGKAEEAKNNGLIFGMSSHYLQKKMGKEQKSNEGLVRIISSEEMRPIKDIFNDFVYGIKSGLSYLNCRSLRQLKNSRIEYIRTGKGTLKEI